MRDTRDLPRHLRHGGRLDWGTLRAERPSGAKAISGKGEDGGLPGLRVGVGGGEVATGLERRDGKAKLAGRIDAGGVVGTPGFWSEPLDRRWCPPLKQSRQRVEEEAWSTHGSTCVE